MAWYVCIDYRLKVFKDIVVRWWFFVRNEIGGRFLKGKRGVRIDVIEYGDAKIRS